MGLRLGLGFGAPPRGCLRASPKAAAGAMAMAAAGMRPRSGLLELVQLLLEAKEQLVLLPRAPQRLRRQHLKPQQFRRVIRILVAVVGRRRRLPPRRRRQMPPRDARLPLLRRRHVALVEALQPGQQAEQHAAVALAARERVHAHVKGAERPEAPQRSGGGLGVGERVEVQGELLEGHERVHAGGARQPIPREVEVPQGRKGRPGGGRDAAQALPRQRQGLHGLYRPARVAHGGVEVGQVRIDLGIRRGRAGGHG
mmetsp:Transcript_15334/g.46105  ORF Transcript_15334/g.46105 Transcript_15334/m.46105 type:complete len:255 (-) Transcript_15334:82-846(-)